MSTDHSRAATGRVVVGVDGSKPSHHALRWARFLAQTTGSTMEAAIAWQPLVTYGFAGIGWSAAPRTPVNWNPEEEARTVLDFALKEVFGHPQPSNVRSTVREGNPAQMLLELSSSASMLVVGSRGYGGFANLLLGSISAACSEHATCPVLVVHGDSAPPHR